MKLNDNTPDAGSSSKNHWVLGSSDVEFGIGHDKHRSRIYLAQANTIMKLPHKRYREHEPRCFALFECKHFVVMKIERNSPESYDWQYWAYNSIIAFYAYFEWRLPEVSLYYGGIESGWYAIFCSCAERDCAYILQTWLSNVFYLFYLFQRSVKFVGLSKQPQFFVVRRGAGATEI